MLLTLSKFLILYLNYYAKIPENKEQDFGWWQGIVAGSFPRPYLCYEAKILYFVAETLHSVAEALSNSPHCRVHDPHNARAPAAQKQDPD
jgi:hypothetical protein